VRETSATGPLDPRGRRGEKGGVEEQRGGSVEPAAAGAERRG
jgi:hypothetical protein